jgi:hypothetical protein
MPNTLAHFAIQAAASRSVTRPPLWPWVAIGCVIPDLPWILQRIVRATGLAIDPWDLRLYVTVQASLALCLILSAAIAALTPMPRRVFALLAANSGLHLLLDASETKWGNGVNLLAPFDWALVNFGWYWTDHPAVYLVSAAGLGAAVWTIAQTPRQSIRLTGRPAWLLTGMALLLGYFIVPAVLLDGPAAADVHYVSTLRTAGNRPNQRIELDRARIDRSPEGPRARLLNGEAVLLAGKLPENGGSYSLRGRFTDSVTIEVEALHAHPPAARDAFSYLGLALLLMVVVKAILPRQR